MILVAYDSNVELKENFKSHIFNSTRIITHYIKLLAVRIPVPNRSLDLASLYARGCIEKYIACKQTKLFYYSTYSSLHYNTSGSGFSKKDILSFSANQASAVSIISSLKENLLPFKLLISWRMTWCFNGEKSGEQLGFWSNLNIKSRIAFMAKFYLCACGHSLAKRTVLYNFPCLLSKNFFREVVSNIE